MKEVIVLIPIYKNFLEEYELKSLEINISNLNSYEVVFIAPNSLKTDYLFLNILLNFKLDVVYFDDSFFRNIKGYNKLMLNYGFYKYFSDYNYILICQLDALVLSNNLDYWISKDFDYIGAPFICEEGDSYFFNSMGNGGLSLRKVAKFLEILDSKSIFYSNYKFFSISLRAGLKYILFIKLLKRLNQIGIKLKVNIFLSFFNSNEDYFWSFYAKFFVNDFRIPSANEALLFSFEVNPRKCFSLTNNQLPFGCHAWQKYDRKFWEEVYPYLKS